MFQLLRHAGVEELEFRPCLVGATSSDPLVDYLPDTTRSVRQLIIDYGLMTGAELEEASGTCRRHLADLDTITTSVVVIQLWGRKPACRAEAR
ncbi:MAG: hypothetical protein ACE5JN_02815 [Candidatus Methylomirabilia bacterium]